MNLREEVERRGLDWIIPEWPAPPGVRAIVTTRNGGFSTGPCASMNLGTRVGDAPEALARNLALVQAVTGVQPHWLSQVHGTAVARVDDRQGEIEADAAVATAAGRAATVRIADCLPVLFCDRAGTQVAAAHAGWRGLCAGVLEATVAAMPGAAGALLAWLGPAIGPAAFEVGDEVRAAFVARDANAAAAFTAFPGRRGKWLADLYALARQRLQRAGVGAIYGGGLCTLSEPARFFSFRRDGTSGRMAALIWLAD
ncbi:MAG: peptidoglycan editing factor PgeF [Betaproteobacteria bacterium]